MSLCKLNGVLVTIAMTFFASVAIGKTVTIGFVGTDAPANYAPLIAAFEKQNPSVKVEYQQIPFRNFNSQIEARVGSKDDSIDVYTADTPRVPVLASRGLLLKLDEYRKEIEAVTTLTEVEMVSHKASLYAFPMWTGSQFLYYNKDILARAGVEAPSSNPKDRITWEKLLERARAVQKNGTKYGFTYQQVDRYFQLQPLFESVGAGSGLTGADLLTPALTGEKWIKVGTWYRDLYETGLGPRGVSPEQTPDLFINGQVGFFYGGLPMLKRFSRAENLNFGVALVPYFTGGKPVTSTGSWAIGISPHSKQKSAAIEFARYLTLTKEGASLASKSTSSVPVHLAAYKEFLEELVAISPKVGPVGEILSYELKNTAVPRPRSVGYVVYEEVMNKAFSDIRNGADVNKTLSQAERQLKSLFSRIQ